ncbi:DgyrCDS2545 [Dimorphilus gyrociliatus]|uniref:Glutathione S-transferase omega n=1 Tax=Dimorphilus gyrociliatus TaxID=2664684 RepID=A0A7I8VB12_9ANNE|nr:DgyrCDS2545 [Dimorphilus gyrociliatus]
MNTKHLSENDTCPEKTGKLRIYSMRFCPFAQRARLILWHKRIQHETVNINLTNKPKWFLQLNPNGATPIIEKDNIIIYESSACCEYLAEMYAKSLIPSDGLTRVRHRMFIDAFSSVTGKYHDLLFSRVDKSVGMPALRNSLKPYEAEIKDKFFGGSEPVLLDFHMWPFIERFAVLEKTLGEKVMTEDELPKLIKWRKNMEDLDCVKKIRKEPEEHMIYLSARLKNELPDYDHDIENDPVL